MVKNILEIEAKELRKIIKDVEKRIKIVTKGKLRVAVTKKGFQYYLLDERCNSSYGTYIKKSEIQLAKEIAQSDYDAKVLKIAKARLQAIEMFLRKYEKHSVKDIFEKMNPGRRALVDGLIISDNEYINQWQSVKYVGKNFPEDAPEFMTEKGERVRSKSEKIIADKLFMLGIPYRYECPLVLEGNVKVYPDFTILRMPERKEVYLEHFGMMDDMEYVNTVIYKLNTYERNGIYVGANLFVTYETSRKPLNIKALDNMIKEVFCVS